MSFTSNVKNEVSKQQMDKIASITLLSAIFKNSAIIENNIKVATENPSVARLIFNIVKELYGISAKITVRQGYNYKKNYIYILEINRKIDEIINDLCLNKNIPDDYILSDDELIRIYLRGVFLTTGSINDPKKSRYHLEFFISDYDYANFIKDLLNSNMASSLKVKEYIYESRSRMINILKPSINESETQFIVQDNQIRFGLEFNERSQKKR